MDSRQAKAPHREHQRADGGEREPVDRPPPFADGRALRAREHPIPRRSKLPRRGLGSINGRSHTGKRLYDVGEGFAAHLEIRVLVE